MLTMPKRKAKPKAKPQAKLSGSWNRSVASAARGIHLGRTVTRPS